MASNNSLDIRRLEPQDAAEVAEFMRSQEIEYLRFFYAFNFEDAAIREMLASVEKDVYSGVFWQARLIGVFFLRGWDAGYQIPTFGLLVDEKHRGNTLKNIMLDVSKMICKLSGINQIMVKIHPENVALKNVPRLGFYQTGVEEATGNVIFHLDF